MIRTVLHQRAWARPSKSVTWLSHPIKKQENWEASFFSMFHDLNWRLPRLLLNNRQSCEEARSRYSSLRSWLPGTCMDWVREACVWKTSQVFQSRQYSFPPWVFLQTLLCILVLSWATLKVSVLLLKGLKLNIPLPSINKFPSPGELGRSLNVILTYACQPKTIKFYRLYFIIFTNVYLSLYALYFHHAASINGNGPGFHSPLRNSG